MYPVKPNNEKINYLLWFIECTISNFSASMIYVFNLVLIDALNKTTSDISFEILKRSTDRVGCFFTYFFETKICIILLLAVFTYYFVFIKIFYNKVSETYFAFDFSDKVILRLARKYNISTFILVYVISVFYFGSKVYLGTEYTHFSFIEQLLMVLFLMPFCCGTISLFLLITYKFIISIIRNFIQSIIKKDLKQ